MQPSPAYRARLPIAATKILCVCSKQELFHQSTSFGTAICHHLQVCEIIYLDQHRMKLNQKNWMK